MGDMSDRAAFDAIREAEYIAERDADPPVRVLNAEVIACAVILGFDPSAVHEIHITTEGVTVVTFDLDADGNRILDPRGVSRKTAHCLEKFGPTLDDKHRRWVAKLRTAMEDDAAGTQVREEGDQ